MTRPTIIGLFDWIRADAKRISREIDELTLAIRRAIADPENPPSEDALASMIERRAEAMREHAARAQLIDLISDYTRAAMKPGDRLI